MGSFGDNMPDLTYQFNTTDTIFEVFSVLLYTFVTGNIIVSILQGYFGDCYCTRINSQVAALLEKEPKLKDVILKCREAALLKPTNVKEAFDIWLISGKEGLDEIEYPGIHDPNQEYAQLLEDYENMEDGKVNDFAKFLLFYKSKPIAFFSCCIDLTIAFIPIIKLDTFSTASCRQDWYLMSELLNVIVFFEYFMLKFTAPQETKKPFFCVRLMSAIICFICCQVLQYGHYDVTEKEIYDWKFVFMVWGFSSLIRFCGVHHMLKFS